MRAATRRGRFGLAGLLALLASCWLTAAPTPAAADAGVHINHLFVIVLENENAESTFGAVPPAPYLGTTMRSAGAFIPNYYGIGHQSLDNYLAMISGQPPNLATQADCLLFTEMMTSTVNSDGVAVGQGCVFSRSVPTIANQLENSGHTWHGYMQDMANSVSEGEPATCRHPAVGAQDTTQAAGPTDQYATRHDPFVYFHSIIDYSTCQSSVVDLDRLPEDLANASTTPEYDFITPDLCADGHDGSCADPYSPGGFAGINAFLSHWVPLIEASPAYQDHGAILVTFDESGTGAESCCNEPIGPNTLNNGGSMPGNGGGRVGAVMVSPCIRPGTVTQTPYNHYSTLRWSEDNFGLAHLADAGTEGLNEFGADVFTRPSCDLGSDAAEARAGAPTRLRVQPRRVRKRRSRVFRFHLISSLPECRSGATIRFAGHRVKTNRRGRAHIKARLFKVGKRLAVARPAGCQAAATKVRVLRRTHG